MEGMNRAIHKDSYFHKSICLPITSKYRDKIEDTNDKLKDKSVNFIRFQIIFFEFSPKLFYSGRKSNFRRNGIPELCT